jgi:Gpi18-like mannosyltransferase
LSLRERRLALAAGFAAAAAMRVGFLVASPENWDTAAYAEVVHVLDSGGALYRDTPRYNYSPAWALTLRALSKVSAPLRIPLHRSVRALLLAADAVTAWFLYRIARDVLARPPDRAAGVALLFFANPVSVFVTGFHAQFDGLAILFLLAALWFEGRRSPRPAAAVGALAA